MVEKSAMGKKEEVVTREYAINLGAQSARGFVI